MLGSEEYGEENGDGKTKSVIKEVPQPKRAKVTVEAKAEFLEEVVEDDNNLACTIEINPLAANPFLLATEVRQVLKTRGICQVLCRMR